MVRQLTAIMFTDMVGYTALMQQDERQAKVNRDLQREILDRFIQESGGRILQYYGDGTLSVFKSAVAAVESAIAIQEALRDVEAEIPLRIGIHSGDVVHDESGVFGDGVNVAARIEGLGIPGSVLISGKVFDEVKNQTEISTRGLGSFNLKNIKHPTRVYAISNPGLEIPTEEKLRPDRAARTRSIAVLPFVNMSSDPENEFFSDGITEEIINALTRVNGLQVTARTSSFAFKNHDQDIRTIADKLGVTHVLEGSVRRAGKRVRVTAQLIGAVDGYHLMSEVYDGDLDDVFALQDDISLKIVEHLAARLGPVPTSESAEGGAVLVHSHSHDTEAYAEYLRGRFEAARWTPDSARSAITHYVRSAELDPDCALPFVGMAKSYLFLGATGHMPADDAYAEAERAAAQANELEDSSGDTHVALAMIRLFQHRDWAGAYEAFQKALSLAPGSAEVHQYYSLYLRTLDEPEEALREAEVALQLDPLSPAIRLIHAESLVLIGDLDQADVELEAILADDPSFRSAVEMRGLTRIAGGDVEGALEHFNKLPGLAGNRFAGAAVRGYALALLGRHDEATEMLDLLSERSRTEPDVSLSMDFALVHQGLGNLDEVFRYFDEALEKGLGGLVFLGGSNPWRNGGDAVRADPRFQPLLARIGYPSANEIGDTGLHET